MSDSVLIILILCTTYVINLMVNRWKPTKRSDDQKGGAKR